MGEKSVSKKSFKASLVKTTISALVVGSIIPFNVLAATPNASTKNTVMGSLAQNTSTPNLTAEQIEALKKVSTDSDVKISPKIDTTTSQPVRVIVEFKQAPAKISMLQKQVEGETTTLSAEKSAVTESHAAFKTFVNGLKTSAKPNGVSALSVTPSDEEASTDESITITREYTHALNGVAMTLPGNLVEKLLDSGVVNRVLHDDIVKIDPAEAKISANEATASDYPENYIPLPGIDGLRKDGITGQGVNVGVIDTGVDYNHPDLTTVYRGYRAKQGEDASKIDPTSVKGWDFVDNDADPMETTIDDWKKAGEPDGTYEHYITYHGTHVSGTIAAQSKASVEFPAQGVAPGVNLYDYRVLGPYGTGYSDAIIGGIDKAVSDGMKVINLSLGGPVNEPLSAEAIAINNATLAGVTCVISAGNSGPNEGTLGTPGASAFAITVGASDFAMSIPTASAKVGNQTFTNFKLLGKGYADNVADLAGKTYDFVDVGLAQAADFKDASGNPIDLKGKVALITRGTNNLNEKIVNAGKAGAVAAIMTNNIDGDIDNYLASDEGFIPTFRMTKADGERLRADGSHSITFTSTGSTVSEGNHLASFSSRGPVANTYDIKPDIVAPGVSVYSTYPYFVHSPGKVDYSNAYARISGTSMASPHIAGVAALILQAHPNYTPADVKAALTNSAGKLNGNYSVYEQGAGLVDVAKAVKNDVSFKAQDTTEQVNASGSREMVNYEKGSLTFGSVYKKDGAVNTSNRTVKVTNRGNKDKTFDLSAEFIKPSAAVNDAAKNGVTFSASSSSVTVKAGETTNFTATINIPDTAAFGRYEGYVNIVNHDDPSETYRMPLAARMVEKGIANVIMDIPAMPTRKPVIGSDFNGNPARQIMFRNNSPMTYMWVVIYDKNGNAIGATTDSPYNMNGTKTDTNYIIGLDASNYYPFIGDPKNEKTNMFTKAVLPEGEYTLKVRATDTTDSKARTYEKSLPIVVDNALPTLTYKDHAPGVYELEDKDFTDEKQDGNTYHAFWVHANLFDEGTAKLAPLGYTQADNTLWYYHNDIYFPEGDFPVDENGDTKFGIEKSDIENGPATITLMPMDVAHNVELINDFHEYAFIKKGTPYMVPTYNKKKVSLNDTITMTLDLHNVKELMSGTFKSAYYHDYFELQGVTVNPEFQKWADQNGVTVNVDTPVKSVDEDYPTHVTDINVGAHLTGGTDFKGFNGNSPFLDVTFKVKDDFWDIMASRFTPDADTTDFTMTTYGSAETKNITAFSRLNQFQIIPKHSQVQTYVRLQGLQNNFTVPLNTVGAKGYAQLADGTVIPGTVIDKGYIDIKGIPVSNEPFKVIVEGPGHLKSIQNVTLGKKSPWGDDIAEFKYIGAPSLQPYGAAGDVNGDGVIDVLDVKQVSKMMGVQNKTKFNIEDLNLDGIVDKQDMSFLVSNLYKSNPDALITPKEMVDGKYATDYFNALGIASSVNTFRTVDSSAHKATFTWNPAVDATAIKIQQSTNDGSSWQTATTEGTLSVTDGKVTVTGLNENTKYQFRVSITGGLNAGVSNAVTLTTKLVPIPNAPVVKGLGDSDATISGKADPNVTVTVKSGDTVVASGKANEAGDFTLQIAKQKAGTVLVITATNDDGKVSSGTTITVVDITAPDAPIVNPVAKKDQTITGRTEANATVMIKMNNEVSEVQADKNGYFSLEIPHKANGTFTGTVISVTAKDAAGNVSAATTVTVSNK